MSAAWSVGALGRWCHALPRWRRICWAGKEARGLQATWATWVFVLLCLGDQMGCQRSYPALPPARRHRALLAVLFLWPCARFLNFKVPINIAEYFPIGFCFLFFYLTQ